jgi:hypothetical protein
VDEVARGLSVPGGNHHVDTGARQLFAQSVPDEPCTAEDGFF